MLLGAASARQHAPKSVSLFASGVEDSEIQDVKLEDDLSPEKVSVLETTKAQNHTTFYGQQQDKPQDKKNVQLAGEDDLGPLHEKVVVLNEEYFRHRNDEKDSIFNFPEGDHHRTTFYTQLDDDLSPEKVSILETTKAQNHTTFYGQQDPKKKQEPVGSGSIDPWVETFSNENMAGIANVHQAQIKKKDIGENGIEPNVHEFASDAVSPLKHIRRDEQMDLNGSGDNGWGNGSRAQKSKKDIGENGIEPNVHEFASDAVSPLKHIRRDEQMDLNGSGDNGWGNGSRAQKNKKDIGENGIEPNVHEFASDSVSPLKHIRRDEQMDLNGSGDNGWGNGSRAQKDLKKKDIGETGIEPNVHEFASDCVSPLKHIRRDEQMDLNGSADNGWGNGSKGSFVQQKLAQKNKSDVMNSDIRPDVWKVTDDNVSAIHEWRTKTPPPTNYEPYTPPASEEKLALAQEPAEKVEGEKPSKKEAAYEGTPEQVSVLEPTHYQTEANSNTPNARTTFYNKKDKMWMYDNVKEMQY